MTTMDILQEIIETMVPSDVPHEYISRIIVIDHETGRRYTLSHTQFLEIMSDPEELEFKEIRANFNLNKIGHDIIDMMDALYTQIGVDWPMKDFD